MLTTPIVSSLWFRQIIIALVAICFATSQLSVAQEERYELGKRLRRFEEAWQQAPDPTRKQSAPILQQAVSSFFSLNLLGAAEKLDQAWVVTRSQPIASWERSAIPYRIQTPTTLIDVATPSITVRLTPFYNKNEKAPEGAKVQWSVTDHRLRVMAERECMLEQAMEGIALATENFPEGDYWIRAKLILEEGTFVFPSSMFSRISEWNSRAQKMSEMAQDQEIAMDDVVRATLREHAQLLIQAGKGSKLESDYPLHQLLSLDESLMASDDPWKKKIRDAAQSHDVWLQLAKGRKRVPVRLRIPSDESAKSGSKVAMPVLFLMHGAGGSENMFFETYGAGGAVQAALDRGWLVVAPRQGIGGMALDCREMLEALEKVFDVDRQRVFIVGHSMGAAQVIRQATLHPELFRAAAVIGGGSKTRDAEKLTKIAWYVAAGELDFGKSGARSFYESMKGAKAPSVRYQEFAGIEHLVIVQACLGDLFAFLDSVQSSDPAAKN